MFAVPRPLEVELGSGDGSFLLAWAAAHPGRNFIGIERLLGRIRKLDRRGRREGLENLRGLRIEAAYALEYLLPPESVEALHVYFPDPWPKRRHHKNRLINEAFPGLAYRVLRAGGVVHLRTDDAAYFERMRVVFEGEGSGEESKAGLAGGGVSEGRVEADEGDRRVESVQSGGGGGRGGVEGRRFEEVPVPADLVAVTTDFEREFLAKGIPTRRVSYRKVAAPEGGLPRG